MPLTDIIIKNAKPTNKQYRLGDSKGLCLLIKPMGGKYWRLRYRFAGKEKELALGVYPEISLKNARDLSETARDFLKKGIDPSQAKKDSKNQLIAKFENHFEDLARAWHANQKQSWTIRHADYVIRRLEADIFPFLGNKPIKDISPTDLLSVLQKIEARGAIDIAHRAQQTCGQIFRYAIAIGKANRDIS